MICINSLCKKLDNNLILNNISFNIDEGKIVALIGPNGAGKTTLLRCLTGIYDVTSGSIKFDGNPVYENPATKENISFLSDEIYYSPMISLNEIIDYYKNTYKNFNFDEFLRMNDLFKINLNKRLFQLSKGMKMKFSIMISLSIGAKYLILDEPTLGLDTVSKKIFIDLLINYIDSNNASILITSHNLQDLEKICDDVIFINNGSISNNSSLDDLKSKFKKIQVAFNDISILNSLNHENIIHIDKLGKVATLICDDYEKAKIYIDSLNPIFIEDLNLSLEEIFIYLLTNKEAV